jgi:hypothetical protein
VSLPVDLDPNAYPPELHEMAEVETPGWRTQGSSNENQ